MMDAQQFAAFLQVFQEQQAQLIAEISVQFEAQVRAIVDSNIRTRSARESSTNMVHVAPFENFEAKKEKFSNYLERFENYYSMKGLTEEKQIAQLLCASVGSDHYNSLSAFLGPDIPLKSLDYTTLVDELKKMLIPKKSVVISQHYFLNIFQKDGQSISEFVADLRRDLTDCEFSVICKAEECKQPVPIADVFLRAQFIRGLRDDWLREQLLQADSTKFDDILEKAVALEASKIESKEFQQHASSSTTNYNTSDINKISRTTGRFQSRQCSSDPLLRPKGQRSRFRRSDFIALGIENLCLRCGKDNHISTNCRLDKSKLNCDKCHKLGHVSRVCLTTLMANLKKSKRTSSTNSLQQQTSDDDFSDSHYDYDDHGLHRIETVNQSFNVVDLYDIGHGSDKYIVSVHLNGRPQRFEVDSGAKFSLIARNDFDFLNLDIPVKHSNLAFRSYSGDIIKPEGKVSINVSYKGKRMTGELHIVPTGHDALLGRQWIRGLGIELGDVDAEMKRPAPALQIQPISSSDEMFKKFAPIFEPKIGCVPGFTVSLNLRKGAKPCFNRERNVPYALLDKVNKELDELEAGGIISPVTTSDWGSPLVVIPKADGGVRICVDYKCGVNERIVQANHPIRKIDDVLDSLRSSRYFCKLDLYKAYLHLRVDEESSTIQTIATHRGTYRVNRLSFGIKTAPSEFNRILSQILKGLQKTEAYFDDIIVHGSTLDECRRNLQACLQRLSDYSLHVNKQKCSFFKEKIEYLGRVIEYNKIRKSPEKIRAIQEMPRPSNVEEVRRFLGLVSYYARFFPNASTTTSPLRRLLQKRVKWIWTAECEAAFLRIKAELCSDRILVPFDPELPLVLATDASPTGVAAVLSHTINGVEKPVAYASRSLTVTECNYSQLDREALAIVFGVSHFYYYLFGTKFDLVTDNQPISRIFRHDKALPQMTSARLLRYASYLSGFNYTLKFKKGFENKNVDCLSRAPLKNINSSAEVAIGNEVHRICAQTILQISNHEITAATIKMETEKDPELSSIQRELLNTSTDSEFTLVDGILFRGDRIYVPASLRPKILQELHETHLGITKMKQLARRYVYWPAIDKEIERNVKGCEHCALTRSNPPKAPVHPWEPPQENWDRVHIDYAGPFQGFNFLVCVDARSKWVEVKVLRDSPSSSNTIHLLEQIFSVHGYPKALVSDNATIFQSDTFHTYCKERGIFQKFIAPGHPATNGLAERSVQTLKKRLKSAVTDNIPMVEKVQQILMRYRATPLTCGKSPAELYLHRKLRIRLDAIFPYQPQRSAIFAPPARFFNEGERVQVRLFINNKHVWQFGVIKKKLGTRHYLVSLDSSDRQLKRHVNQLRSTLVPKSKTVTFGPSKSYSIPMISKPKPQFSERNNQPTAVTPTTPVLASPTHPVPFDSPIPGQRPQRQRRLPIKLNDYVVF